MQTVKLISDFRDYYDHWFDGHDAELAFERMSSGGIPRSQAMLYLQSLGLHIPPFGQVRYLHWQLKQMYTPFSMFSRFLDVVVHLDESAHRGEGKIKLPLPDALKLYPDHFAVQHIPALPSGLGRSLRYLQVGDKVFWLEYVSSSDWRSNCGEVTVEVLTQEADGYHPRIKRPLFAVDFVPGNALYAIDFNTAPDIQWTGVEKFLPAQAAAETIKEAVILFKKDAAQGDRGSEEEAE